MKSAASQQLKFMSRQLQNMSSTISKQLHQREEVHEVPEHRSDSTLMDNFAVILNNNKNWAQDCLERDPTFFAKLVRGQQPEYLWVGCSDSRVPSEEIVGLRPGELFVHRNIANQIPPSDINALAVIQYSVQVLKVTHIVVAGHYNCGGIRASFNQNDDGPLETWVAPLRDLRKRFRSRLQNDNEQQNYHLLSQLNVKQQVYNIARIPIVQQAWKQGQNLSIHGVIYDLRDGLLKDLGITLSKIRQLPEAFRIIV